MPRSESLGSLASNLSAARATSTVGGGLVFRGDGVAAVEVQTQEVAHLVDELDGDDVLTRRFRIRGDEAGVIEDRPGDGLGEHRLGQQVVAGRLRLLEGQHVVDAGLSGEPHHVAARVGGRGREVRAAAQRVGDADRVVVGIEQRALVAEPKVVTGGAGCTGEMDRSKRPGCHQRGTRLVSNAHAAAFLAGAA